MLGVFIKWLMNSLSVLEGQVVFICTCISVSVMVWICLAWNLLWLIFMKVVVLPCYTQVFAFGESL